MYETTGALTIVEPAALLALIVIPLLWTLGVLTAGRSMTLSARVAMAGAAGNVGYAALIARRSFAMTRGHVLGEHLGSILRIGQLDLAGDLVLDPLAACFAVLVTMLALAVVLHEVWGGRGDRRLAWVGLLTAGALLIVSADGFAPFGAGLGLTTVATVALARGSSSGPVAVAVLGDGSIVLALFLAFWALGGSFTAASGYESDPLPRMVLVGSTGLASDTTLSMNAPIGAVVTTDEGPPLPGEPLRSPFVVPVTPAGYTFRVQLGPGAGEVVVPRVTIAGGHAYTLAPFGPTTGILALRDQARVARPVALGVASMDARELLATRSIGGLRATFMIALLLALGLVARLVALASQRAVSSLAVAVEALVPAYLAVRFADLLEPRSPDGATVAIAGAVAAVVLGGHAATLATDDAPRAVRGVLAAAIAVVVTAAGFGMIAGGLLVASAAAFSAAAALAAIEARRDLRWLGVASAATCGLVPASGISAGVATTVSRAFDPTATWHGSGAYVAVAVAVAVALAAFASFRMYDAIVSKSATRGARGQGAIAVVLSSLALASGIVFGMGSAAFGGRVVPLVTRLLGLDVVVAGTDAYSALALAIVAPAIGFFAARHARSDALADAAGAPARMAIALGAAFARAFDFLGGGVRALDGDVIEDVGRSAGQGILLVAAALGRADRFVDERITGRILGRAADVTAVRLSLDHPRVLTRFALIFVLVMVALLALVVFSSVLLG